MEAAWWAKWYYHLELCLRGGDVDGGEEGLRDSDAVKT